MRTAPVRALTALAPAGAKHAAHAIAAAARRLRCAPFIMSCQLVDITDRDMSLDRTSALRLGRGSDEGGRAGRRRGCAGGEKPGRG